MGLGCLSESWNVPLSGTTKHFWKYLLAGNVFSAETKSNFHAIGILEGSSMDPDCLVVL